MKLYYTFDDIEQFIEISKGQTTIGRSSAATFTIRHDTISKVHALLTYENGILTIEDMESSNGIFVNSVKIKKSEVKPTDNLKIGKVSFRIELSPEELSAYKAINGGGKDDDATPAEGVEAISDNPGLKSETFFDLAELNKLNSNAPSAVASPNQPASAAKMILGNRKTLLLVVGSLTVILLMAIVVFSLNNVSDPKSRKILVDPATNAFRDNQIEFEKRMKEGLGLFLNSPHLAKEKFLSAQKLLPNNNAISSLIQLSEIWNTGEKNWMKVPRADFRKNIDDIRNEDEGQSGAILYDFINEMTRLEEFEKKNENVFAEINLLITKFSFEEALTRVADIPPTSVFHDIANKKIAQAKVNLMEELKVRVSNARGAGDAPEEVKLINKLLPMLAAADQKDYVVRKEKLQRELNKETLWKQGVEALEVKKDLDAAKQIFDLFEPVDPHYYEAVEKLSFIKDENARQNIKTLYDVAGEGKAALKIIADTMSVKLNDLADKISKVDSLYSQAILKGESNPDDKNAQILLEQLLEVEQNPENAYHKKAKKLLADWKDPTQICNRKYVLAQEKIKVRDFATARQILKEIREMSSDFNISDVMKSIDKYVQFELNSNVRNARTLEMKRSTLVKLSKIVLLGDNDYDFVTNSLMEMDAAKQ